MTITKEEREQKADLLRTVEALHASEASVAVMREALRELLACTYEHREARVFKQANDALATDAGKALLEEVKALRARLAVVDALPPRWDLRIKALGAQWRRPREGDDEDAIRECRDELRAALSTEPKG